MKRLFIVILTIVFMMQSTNAFALRARSAAQTPGSSQQIKGAMHETVATPKAAASAILGVKEEVEDRPKSLVLAYSPQASEDPAIFKLILSAAEILSRTKPDTHIVVSYKDNTQKERIEAMLTSAPEQVKNMIKVAYLSDAKRTMGDFLLSGYVVRYLRTNDPGDKPWGSRWGIENALIPSITEDAITGEFQQEFEREIERLTKA